MVKFHPNLNFESLKNLTRMFCAGTHVDYSTKGSWHWFKNCWRSSILKFVFLEKSRVQRMTLKLSRTLQGQTYPIYDPESNMSLRFALPWAIHEMPCQFIIFPLATMLNFNISFKFKFEISKY